MTFPSTQFKDCASLVNYLKARAKKYPLIDRLYIPIIQSHAKNYPNFSDFDEWLLLITFQLLWKSDDDKLGEHFSVYLYETEKGLQQIYEALGEAGFSRLCDSFLIFAKHRTVNGVHNKVLDFYGEIRGMKYFINNAYSIQRIERVDGKKSADFFAVKKDEVVVVECKFIHASNNLRTYAKRYMDYLSNYPELWLSNSIRPWHTFIYNEIPKELSDSNMKEIKDFINRIIKEKPVSLKLEMDLGYKGKIDYLRKEALAPALVTIRDQVEALKPCLGAFFDEYVYRRATQLLPQLEPYSRAQHKPCAYIFIELDGEYNLPWDEMQQLKIDILEDFKNNHDLEIEIVIEMFPTPIFSEKNNLNI